MAKESNMHEGACTIKAGNHTITLTSPLSAIAHPSTNLTVIFLNPTCNIPVIFSKPLP